MGSTPFHHAKPGITAQGFRTAVRDYTEPTVVEELAANSYDADAATVLVLLDSQNRHLYVVDDGRGFSEESIKNVAMLGGGDKQDAFTPDKRRHYLGSYGYGLKSTLNVASKVAVRSYSADCEYRVAVDWTKLDEAVQPNFEGYPVHRLDKSSGLGCGTIIDLALRNPTDKSHLETFGEVLANLPEDAGGFSCYYGMFDDVRTRFEPWERNLADLGQLAARLEKRKLLTRAGSSLQAEIEDCDVEEVTDKEDKTVKARVYFAGLKGDKVNQLKRGLRGIYVRIHGRLLKQSFTGREYTYNISKWVKFESGLRIELTVDWLRDQISLSREGVRFSNPKLEGDFKALVGRLVSRFIQPRLKLLEKKRSRSLNKRLKQRLELARRRADRKAGTVLEELNDGFCFRPETDGELALILSQRSVMKQVGAQYALLDYNDQASFDAVMYDGTRREYVYAEFEPTLIEFLEHKEKDEVQEIFTWTLGKWRLGARKKGRGGHFELVGSSPQKMGRYRLLEFASSSAKKPRKDYQVHVIEEILK